MAEQKPPTLQGGLHNLGVKGSAKSAGLANPEPGLHPKTVRSEA
jgi:hypothetical protein